MFQPLNDKVLVKADDPETISPGGILIPASAEEKAMQGKVIATGPGRWENGGFKELQVKVGDTVIYGKYGGTDIKYNNEDYLIVVESDILGIATARKG